MPPINRLWPSDAVAAIDVPIFAHKFIYTEKTYDGLEKRFYKFGQELREQNLEPIFCFDGGQLDIKDDERRKRSVARDRQMVRNVQKKSENIEAMLSLGICIKRSFSTMIKQSTESVVALVEASDAIPNAIAEVTESVRESEVTESKVESSAKIAVQDSINPDVIESLINDTINSEKAEQEQDPLQDPSLQPLEELEIEVPEYFEGILKPTSKDYDTLYAFLESAGFMCRKAQYEAEALCAHLVCTSEAWCAVTEDTDAVAFGSHRTIYKLFQDPIMVDLEAILKDLELNQEQFIDLCCMLGCDFCDNVYKVGPETAYKLIKTHGSWPSVYEHMRCRWPEKTRESADVFNARYPAAVGCLKSRAFEIK